MTRTAFALALLLSVAAPLQAQRPLPDTLNFERALTTARRDLTELVVAQEVYFAEHSTYATTIAALGDEFRATVGNRIRLVHVSAVGFGAILESDTLLGTCVVWVGNLEENQKPRTEREQKDAREGDPTCDAQPATSSAARRRP